jgi:hypothetical protein
VITPPNQRICHVESTETFSPIHENTVTLHHQNTKQLNNQKQLRMICRFAALKRKIKKNK